MVCGRAEPRVHLMTDEVTRNRVALVIGGSRGLGRACADRLSAQGCEVVVASRTASSIDQPHLALDFDIETDDPATLIASVEAAAGPVDILVLNGGGPPRLPAKAVMRSDIQATINALVTPQIDLALTVLAGMQERRFGRILVIGSTSIVEPIPDLALSNLGRSALAAWTKTLSREVMPDCVTVNLVLPGRIETERLKSLRTDRAAESGSTPEAVYQHMVSDIPAGRFGRPDEFAAAVGFLASDSASYITGTALRVDGGLARGL